MIDCPGPEGARVLLVRTRLGLAASGWTARTSSPCSRRPHADGTPRCPGAGLRAGGRPAAGQERIHLDLNSPTLEDQAATVARLLELGATHADVGQAADAKFVVLADPEGNHFCVIEPRPEYAHLGFDPGYTLAAHDADALRDVLASWPPGGPPPARSPATWCSPRPTAGAPLEIITRPTMPRSDAKVRVHLDVAPSADEDQADVVDRLLAARRDPSRRRPVRRRARGSCSPTPRATSSASSSPRD